MRSDETKNLHQSDEAKYSDSLIHRDNVLWQLWVNAENNLHALLCYVLRWTEYDKGAEEAYQSIRELIDKTIRLETLLLVCAKNEKGE